MKIGLFSDPHCCSAVDLGLNRRPALSYGKIKAAMEKFKKEAVDFCVCLGDLTDHVEGDTKEDCQKNLHKVMEIIRQYEIPFYLVVGNHDYLMLNGDDLKMEKLDTPPYVIETEKYNFIALDGNYRSNMERFDKAGVVWDDANLPPFQIDFLKSALAKSEKECIILIHENLDPTVDSNHIVKNAKEIREIIASSGKAKMVIQGHFHWGSKTELDGIPYLTLEAMCLGEENHYLILDI